MDKRYVERGSACLENITDALRNNGVEVGKAIQDAIVEAFGEGYDAGYCAAAEDLRDIE